MGAAKGSLGDRERAAVAKASVVEAFARNAGQAPERLCLRFEGDDWSYGRLLREAEDRSERPPQLRLYVSGSAPLGPQALEQFEGEFGQRILERYGMTETGMNLTNPYEGERRPGTVGMPFPAGAVGEIEVRDQLTEEER